MSNMIRIVLTVVALVAFLAGPIQTASAQANTDYNDVAVIVSEPIFDETSVKKAREAYSDGGVMSLKEYQRQRLNALRRLDAAIESAREKIGRPLLQCNSTYQEIRRLDSNTPDYEGIVKQSIAAAPAMLKKQKNRNPDDTQAIDALAIKAIWEVGAAIFNAYNLSTERDNYQRHYSTSRSTTKDVMAGLVPRRYTTPERRPANKAITIPYVNPSLANTYVNDVIAIRNDSGKALVACTLLVNLRGVSASGGASEADRHYHYVSYWPAGEYRYVWYPSRGLKGIATNESVDVIRSVEVSFYCDQFTTTATFDFGGKRYDDYVKKWADDHLKPAAFTGRWYTDAENLVDPAGFQVTYKGDISRFTVQKVTVEAIQGDRSVRIFDGESSWSSSQKKWICHRNFNPVNPSKINVIITFPGSSYEHVVFWTR
jgi:hypothetical protein